MLLAKRTILCDNHFEEKRPMESNELYLSIIRSFANKNEGEGEWFEFKMNKSDPDDDRRGHFGSCRIWLGSAGWTRPISSGESKTKLMLLLGSTFDPWKSKKGNEDLIPWLRLEVSSNHPIFLPLG
jgi:hypothetical protein